MIFVLGHENCGAVDAVIQNNTKDIEAVAQLIEPTVKAARSLFPKNLLEEAVKMNARKMKQFLLNSPSIAALVKEKKIAIYAAYYHFANRCCRTPLMIIKPIPVEKFSSGVFWFLG